MSAFNVAVFYAGSGEQIISLNVDMCAGQYLVSQKNHLSSSCLFKMELKAFGIQFTFTIYGELAYTYDRTRYVTLLIYYQNKVPSQDYSEVTKYKLIFQKNLEEIQDTLQLFHIKVT